MKTLIRYFVFPFTLLIIALLSLPQTGCTDEAVIPSRLRMDTIILDSTSYDSVGSVSHKIEYAFVYIDDNLQGVYQMPFVVPVIGEGTKTIRVYGGVKESGFSSQAMAYNFYDYWESTVDLSVNDTAIVSPHVKYKHIEIPFILDFENLSELWLDRESGGGTCTYSPGPDVKEGVRYGLMTLGEGQSDMVCTTKVITTPKDKILGYFVEMDYKNNCDFLVGIKTSQESETIIGIKPKADWNKIYINITSSVDAISGTDLQLYFIIPQDTTIADQEVKIDNLKLVFSE